MPFAVSAGDRPPDVRDGRSDRRTPVGSASQLPNVLRTSSRGPASPPFIPTRAPLPTPNRPVQAKTRIGARQVGIKAVKFTPKFSVHDVNDLVSSATDARDICTMSLTSTTSTTSPAPAPRVAPNLSAPHEDYG